MKCSGLEIILGESADYGLQVRKRAGDETTQSIGRYIRNSATKLAYIYFALKST